MLSLDPLSDMASSEMRMVSSQLTNQVTYIFVEPFETPLPRQQEIGIFQCLVLHHGLNGPSCRSRGVQGHKPGDDACKAKPKDKILAFKGYQHPLSNHYPCKLSVYDIQHHPGLEWILQGGAFQCQRCLHHMGYERASKIWTPSSQHENHTSHIQARTASM